MRYQGPGTDPLSRARSKVRVGYASGGSGGGLFGSLGRAARSVWRAVPTFPDDRYRNQLQHAQGGIRYSTKGLNARQRAEVERAAAAARRRRR